MFSTCWNSLIVLLAVKSRYLRPDWATSTDQRMLQLPCPTVATMSSVENHSTHSVLMVWMSLILLLTTYILILTLPERSENSHFHRKSRVKVSLITLVTDFLYLKCWLIFKKDRKHFIVLIQNDGKKPLAGKQSVYRKKIRGVYFFSFMKRASGSVMFIAAWEVCKSLRQNWYRRPMTIGSPRMGFSGFIDEKATYRVYLKQEFFQSSWKLMT